MRKFFTLLAVALFALPLAYGQVAKAEEPFKPQIKGPLPRLTPNTQKIYFPKGTLVDHNARHQNVGIVNNGMFRYMAEGEPGGLTNTNTSAWFDVTGKQITPYNNWAYGTFDVDACSFTRREDNREKGVFKQRCGILHRDGNVILLPDEYRSISDFKDGVAVAIYNKKIDYKDVGYLVYLDIYGRQIYPSFSVPMTIEPYDYPRPVSEGLRPYMDFKTKRWGFIDQGGKVIIPAKYHEARSFSDGLAAVAVELKEASWSAGQSKYVWSYVDKTGKVVLDRAFEGRDYWLIPRDFNDGYALVRTPTDGSEPRDFKAYYYINTKGEKVSPDYFFASDFKDGNAFVMHSSNGTYSEVIDDKFIVVNFTLRMDIVNSIFPEYHGGAFWVNSNQRTKNIYPSGQVMVGSDNYDTRMEPFRASGDFAYATKKMESGVIKGLINRTGEFSLLFERYSAPELHIEAQKAVKPLKETYIASEKFPIPKHTLTVMAWPGYGGTASGSGVYEAGKSVVLTAKCANGYRFYGWFIGEIRISSALSYTHYTQRYDQLIFARFVNKANLYRDDEYLKKIKKLKPDGTDGPPSSPEKDPEKGGDTGTPADSTSGRGELVHSEEEEVPRLITQISPNGDSVIFNSPFSKKFAEINHVMTTAYMEFDPKSRLTTAYGNNQMGVLTFVIDTTQRVQGTIDGGRGVSESSIFITPFRIDAVTMEGGISYLELSGGGLTLWDYVIIKDVPNSFSSKLMKMIMETLKYKSTCASHKYRVSFTMLADGSIKLGLMERFTIATGWVDPQSWVLKKGKVVHNLMLNSGAWLPNDILDGGIIKPNGKKLKLSYKVPMNYPKKDNPHDDVNLWNMVNECELEFNSLPF